MTRLREREAATTEMATLLERMKAGRGGGCLFVVGEAGLGKTSILAEAGRRARSEGFGVATGRGDPMEASLPFGLVAQAFDDLGAGDLVTEASVGYAPETIRAARFYGAMRFFEGADRPLLLAFDDLHWADPDSLALVSFLCRRLRTLPVAVIGSCRPWPPDAEELARSLAGTGCAGVASLAPLSLPATSALVAETVGAPLPEELVRRVFTLCAGNPFLIEQAAHAIGRGEALPDEMVDRHLLLGRFAGLPAPALRAARAAAVMGTRFHPELLDDLAHLGGESPLAVEALWRSGLVRSLPDRTAEFVHPLLAQAVYEDTPLPARIRLHRRCFEILAARGAEPEAAEHALRGEFAGDVGVIAVLEDLGEKALATGAPAAAASYLQAAVELSGDRARVQTLLAFGSALTLAGRLSGALAVYDRVLSSGDVTVLDRAEALRLSGRALWAAGSSDQGELRLAEAARLAESTSVAAAVRVLLEHAWISAMRHGPVAALPLASRALEVARGGRSQRQVSRAEAAWGLLALQSGNGGGLDVLASARRSEPPLSKRPGGLAEIHGSQVSADYCYWVAAGWVERFDDAEALAGSALEEAERTGTGGLVVSLIVRAMTLARVGRLAEGLTLAQDMLDRVEFAPTFEPFVLVAESYLLEETGESQRSEASWQRAAAHSAVDAWFVALWLQHIRGLRLLREGRAGEASDHYRRAEEIGDAKGVGEPCVVPWAGHGVAAHLAAGRLDDARRLIGWLEGCAEQLPCRWPRAVAAVGRAALAERDGDSEGAEAYYHDGLAHLDKTELHLDRVEVLVALGMFLRRLGRSIDARLPLAEGLSQAERMGAGALARLAREQLHLAGGRRHRDRDAQRRLSPSEERVARVAAEGASNREIARRLSLSEGTVKTHLEHIYGKLGIHSRHELIVVWTAQRNAPPAEQTP